MEQVKLYDTTLRDGAQREGITFTVEDKLKITQELDKLGIHYIEGGWPASNPKDVEYFKRVKSLPLKKIKVVAFGSTRKKETNPKKDENLISLLESQAQAICIFGKSWDLHVRFALKTSLDENLKMIYDSLSFFKKRGLEVIYDAEHFFDGYKKNSSYALKTLKVAEEAGADWIVLCDTNGGTLPTEVGKIMQVVRETLVTPLGIHAHNDSECAVANTLIAVEKGATQVQGTINGYGERCGNANLCSVIPNLVLKMGIPVITKEQLKLLTEASHYVAEIANIAPDTHQPYVGQSSFTHKGGVHISALTKRKETYEHIDPALIGNIRRIVVSELAGKSTIVLKAKELGIDLSKEPVKVMEILKKIKELEHIGYHFEAADGSFEILIKKVTGSYQPFFKLESFRVLVEKMEDGRLLTEATIKLYVNNKRVIATAEGNGPVNALDNALRLAMEKAYPALSNIQLTDYKVRVLNAKKGTAAVVRVLIETSDGEQTWGTVGVSENIIEASWQALVDSIEYGLTHAKKKGKN